MKLIIEIELTEDGAADGYDAYQAIAQSNIPRNRGQEESGDLRYNTEYIGTWRVQCEFIDGCENEDCANRPENREEDISENPAMKWFYSAVRTPHHAPAAYVLEHWPTTIGMAVPNLTPAQASAAKTELRRLVEAGK